MPRNKRNNRPPKDTPTRQDGQGGDRFSLPVTVFIVLGVIFLAVFVSAFSALWGVILRAVTI